MSKVGPLGSARCLPLRVRGRSHSHSGAAASLRRRSSATKRTGLNHFARRPAKTRSFQPHGIGDDLSTPTRSGKGGHMRLTASTAETCTCTFRRIAARGGSARASGAGGRLPPGAAGRRAFQQGGSQLRRPQGTRRRRLGDPSRRAAAKARPCLSRGSRPTLSVLRECGTQGRDACRSTRGLDLPVPPPRRPIRPVPQAHRRSSGQRRPRRAPATPPHAEADLDPSVSDYAAWEEAGTVPANREGRGVGQEFTASTPSATDMAAHSVGGQASARAQAFGVAVVSSGWRAAQPGARWRRLLRAGSSRS